MRIGGLGGINTNAYQMTMPGFSRGSDLGQVGSVGETGAIVGADDDKKVQGATGSTECQTCKERKYVDGSDENVSFKSPAHISPEAAGGAVRGHEGEHVANAYSKAAKDNGRVVNASVSIHTAVCPECGRTYVAGGTTRTMIKYNTENPYGKNQKSSDAAKLIGGKMDFRV